MFDPRKEIEEQKKILRRMHYQPIISKLAYLKLKKEWAKLTKNMSPYERIKYWASFFNQRYAKAYFEVALELSKKLNLPIDHLVNPETIKKWKEKGII